MSSKDMEQSGIKVKTGIDHPTSVLARKISQILFCGRSPSYQNTAPFFIVTELMGNDKLTNLATESGYQSALKLEEQSKSGCQESCPNR